MKYQVGRIICHQCNKNIRRGIRKFGPAQVRCGNCDTVLSTNLDEWANLSSGRKTSLAIQEILIPSWIGVQASSCNGLLATVLLQITFWFLCWLPFSLIAFAIGDSTPIASVFFNILMYLGMLVYPLLLIVRLVRMIRESNAFTLTKTPPVWK
jgi:hypothetical protein